MSKNFTQHQLICPTLFFIYEKTYHFKPVSDGIRCCRVLCNYGLFVFECNRYRWHVTTATGTCAATIRKKSSGCSSFYKIIAYPSRTFAASRKLPDLEARRPSRTTKAAYEL